MDLIIAEKPVLGRAIADAVEGQAEKIPEGIRKGKYVITWSYGHLLELVPPDDYDPGLKKWSLDTLPIYFPDWKVKPKNNGQAKKRLNGIGRLLKEADRVIHAGDPDEEGQLLIDEILRWFRYTGPVFRLKTGDTTRSALKRALDNIDVNSSYVNMGWSAYARSVADYTVGINMSRYFTLNNNALLAVGRVQTPTLGLVVNRDRQIEEFGKVEYYEVSAEMHTDGKTFSARYEPQKEDPNLTDGRILNREYAEKKAAMIRGQTIHNAKVTYTEKKAYPPLPFSLVELQSYCSSHFGISPKETLDITQRLRDRYSAITYNRSNCQYLSMDQHAEAPATLAQVTRNIHYTPAEMDASIVSRAFNDSSITAHTAIIPQDNPVDISILTDLERKVYLAICKYYLAQFMPPAIKGITKFSAALEDGGKLTASSTRILKNGYLTLFKNDFAKGLMKRDQSSPLSDIAPGTYDASAEKTDIEKKQTKPPARYTKASLNKDMTQIAKYVDDPEVKKLLLEKDKDDKNEHGSIGTVATRADIIEKLIERHYLEEKGKKLFSTSLGREFYRILPDELRKPDMTAYWWALQEKIRSGESDYTILMNSVNGMIESIIHRSFPKIDQSIIPASMKGEKGGGTRKALGKCPWCGGSIYSTPAAYSCSNWKKTNCSFAVWKNQKKGIFAGVRFSEAEMSRLLQGKGVRKKTLKSKSGKKFSATVFVNTDSTKPFPLRIEFDQNTVKGDGKDNA